jgi:hypothetical protein
MTFDDWFTEGFDTADLQEVKALFWCQDTFSKVASNLSFT